MTDQQNTAPLRDLVQHARRALDEAEAGPDAATLAAAPTLNLWQPIMAYDTLFLAGEVTGHPLIRGNWIRTSPLIFLAPDLTWARTLNRFYRLNIQLHISFADAFVQQDREPVIILDACGWPALSIDDARRYLVQYQRQLRRIAAH